MARCAGLLLLCLLGEPAAGSLGITKTVVIALDPTSEASQGTLRGFHRLMGSPRAELFQAVQGVPANTTLELYTRYLIDNPCSPYAGDVVRTSGMVGCFLSHMQVLQQMRPGDVYAVFEEDARLIQGSEYVLQELGPFVQRGDFDMLRLQVLPHDETDDRTAVQLSPAVQLRHCVGRRCWIEGSVGYIVTFAGAAKVLPHASSLVVQFDGLVSLVANYEPEFRLLWTHPPVVYPAPHPSTVQEQCGPGAAVAAAALSVAAAGLEVQAGLAAAVAAFSCCLIIRRNRRCVARRLARLIGQTIWKG